MEDNGRIKIGQEIAENSQQRLLANYHVLRPASVGTFSTATSGIPFIYIHQATSRNDLRLRGQVTDRGNMQDGRYYQSASEKQDAHWTAEHKPVGPMLRNLVAAPIPMIIGASFFARLETRSYHLTIHLNGC